MTLCVDQWQSTCGVNQYRSQTQSTLFTPKKLAQALVAEAWTDSLSDSSLFQNHHPVNKAYLLTAISSTVSFVPTLYGRGQECLAVAVAYPTTLSVSPTLLISDPHLLGFDILYGTISQSSEITFPHKPSLHPHRPLASPTCLLTRKRQ